MKQISYPNYIAPLGASFASSGEATRNMSVVQTDLPELKYAGTVLTQADPEEKTVATVNPEYHTFVIGETGCGKTRRVILPTIRLTAKTRRSMVITDPKGELYRMTGKALENRGYGVLVLNLRDPGRSVRWNPLDIIEKKYHSGAVQDKDRAVLMLADLADALKERVHNDKDVFWENCAVRIFTGVALLILETLPDGNLTFENIAIVARDLFESADGRIRFSHDKGYDPVAAVLSLPKNSPIVSSLNGMISAPSTTRGSMIAVFEEMIGLYITQHSLMDLFSRSEFDIEDIGRKPTAVYLIVPDDSAALYPIVTVFVKQVYSMLIGLADGSANGVLENEVSFILDEFSNFAPFNNVDSMLTAARSRGMTFTLVCQSMEQLSKKYKDGVSEILMSNCRVWLYMSSRNYAFLERLTKLAGNYVSPYTGESRPLLSVHELQKFEMGQVLILYDRNKPAYGFLPDYSQYDFGDSLSEMALPPVHAPAPRIIADAKKAFRSLANASEKSAKPASPAVPEWMTRMTESCRKGEKKTAEETENGKKENGKTDNGKTDNGKKETVTAAAGSGEPGTGKTVNKETGAASMPRVASDNWILAKQTETEYTYLRDNERLVIFLPQGELSADARGYLGISLSTSVSSKNNLAYLLRRGELRGAEKIDVGPLRLTPQLLLDEGVRQRDPLSLMNYALLVSGARADVLGNITEGRRFLSSFAAPGDDHWRSVISWWLKLASERMEPEGALVLLWLYELRIYRPAMTAHPYLKKLAECIERIPSDSVAAFSQLYAAVMKEIGC